MNEEKKEKTNLELTLELNGCKGALEMTTFCFIALLVALVMLGSLSIWCGESLKDTITELKAKEGQAISVFQLPRGVDCVTNGKVVTTEKTIIWIVSYKRGDEYIVVSVTDDNELPRQFIITMRNGSLVIQKVE